MDSEKKIIPNIDTHFLRLNIILIIIFTVVAISVITKINDDYSLGGDLSNYYTLIIEVAIGIIITLIVYHISKKSERKNQQTLDDINKIVKEEKNIRDEKYKIFRYYLMDGLGCFYSSMSPDSKVYQGHTKLFRAFLRRGIKNLEIILTDYNDFIKMDERSEIESYVREMNFMMEKVIDDPKFYNSKHEFDSYRERLKESSQKFKIDLKSN